MNPRPIIQIRPRPLDLLIEALCFLCLVAIWIYTYTSYDSLPDDIPAHFDLKGMPDRHGSKSTLFAVPGFITAIYILLTVLQQFPHRFNYARAITNENAVHHYTLATQFVRSLKLILIVLFGAITYKIIAIANDKTDRMEIGIFIVAFVLIVSVLFVLLAKSSKNKSSAS